MIWSHGWLILVSLQCLEVQGAWVLSSTGASCDAACTGLGHTCEVSQMRLITSVATMDYALNAGTLQSCDDYPEVTPDTNDVPAQPFQYFFSLTNSHFCFEHGETSTCAASGTDLVRLCCCLPALAVPSDECPVPTTTSSTVTSTSSTATSVTSSTTSVTTQTTQTTTVTSFTTQTQTLTTLTTTLSTLTVTTSSVVTQTTTRSTETTTSVTDTTTTVTTFTTTSSTQTFTTQTTTTGANAFLVVAASYGDTSIVVNDATGFAVNDMIRLYDHPHSEYVEITSIGTTSARRLATYPQFQLATPIVNNYGIGTGITNWGPASLFTGGDPVTYFGGRKWKFWMPLHEELLLLATPEIRLYGKAFPGPEPGMQWFDRFVVTFPDDRPIVQVGVKAQRNASWAARRCGNSRFENLEIHLGSEARPLQDMRHLQYSAGEGVRFEINCRNQAARTEYLYFESESLLFAIMSSHAGVDFREDPELAFKYMHLDFIVVEARRPQSYTGILPQIWEVQPRSPEVAAMLVPPDQLLQVCQAQECR